jgi:small GTP-binding protein
MSTPRILDQHVVAIRSRIDEVVKDLHELAHRIPNEDLAQTVSELRNRINEPFMFVIVGEVKAGKSSFINALLDTGREITEVGPQPVTDTVQQIMYGDEEEIIKINPYLKKILLPVDILQEIAIVDTPGTNTIIEQHQEITERFVPASDLIVFVFEAKNPYRESAWNFFDYIHADWRKKVIFVLQQKDLIDEEGLQINLKGVTDHAKKKGVESPLVFAVSAKQEQEGNKEVSGFAPLRTYIRENITGGKAPVLKLQNNLELSHNLSSRILDGLQTRKAQFEADVTFREDVKTTLADQTEKSLRQSKMLIENILAGYDRITREKGEALAAGISFFTLLRRSIAGLFSRQASVKEWLEQLTQELGSDLEIELQKKLREGVFDLAESIQQMAKLIDLKIQNSKTILKHNHAVFANIAEKRSNVLRELQDTFGEFMSRTENFTSDELFPDKRPLSPNLLTGSGIAVIGAIITAAVNIPVFDITGGVLTAVGLLFAGVSSSVKRKKILNSYQQEIDKGRLRIEKEVEEKLHTYIHELQHRIDGNFSDFDIMLEEESKEVDHLAEEHAVIHQNLEAISEEVASLSPE